MPLQFSSVEFSGFNDQNELLLTFTDFKEVYFKAKAKNSNQTFRWEFTKDPVKGPGDTLVIKLKNYTLQIKLSPDQIKYFFKKLALIGQTIEVRIQYYDPVGETLKNEFCLVITR